MKKTMFYHEASAAVQNGPLHIGTAVLVQDERGRFLPEKRSDSEQWAFIGGGMLISEESDELNDLPIAETQLDLPECSRWKNVAQATSNIFLCILRCAKDGGTL